MPKLFEKVAALELMVASLSEHLGQTHLIKNTMVLMALPFNETKSNQCCSVSQL